MVKIYQVFLHPTPSADIPAKGVPECDFLKRQTIKRNRKKSLLIRGFDLAAIDIKFIAENILVIRQILKINGKFMRQFAPVHPVANLEI